MWYVPLALGFLPCFVGGEHSDFAFPFRLPLRSEGLVQDIATCPTASAQPKSLSVAFSRVKVPVLALGVARL